MPAIVTVRGELAPQDLGFCHAHEHVCLEKGKSYEINPALCIDDPARTLQELREFYAAGGRALADAQPVGCGRNPVTLRHLSEESGVHIIASTGFHKMQFYPKEHWIFSHSETELCRLFCEELQTGMYALCDAAPPTVQTDIRAGFIKTALDTVGLDAQYQKLFSAAARTAVQTGAALMVHVEQNADPRPLADFLELNGVKPGRIIYCHLDRAVQDLCIHRDILRRGSYLEYDTVGREKYHSNAHEVEIVQEILSFGFAHQLLMALDVTRTRLCAYGGAPGLAFIREKFLPMLRAQGIAEEDIRRIFTENPAAAFAQTGKNMAE